MSASLVGSEMCIRDSKNACGSRHEGKRGNASWTNAQRHHNRAAQGGRGAVSYTHLTLPTICSV
eukprot:8741506-Alexandrium_andersonii.AAC.1